jgi:ribosomal protein L39E
VYKMRNQKIKLFKLEKTLRIIPKWNLETAQ